MPMKILSSLIFHIILLFLFSGFCSAADTLNSNVSITYGETLVSSGQSFELGFFSLSNSGKWYIGIWYMNFPKFIVWIANRETPLRNSSGVLTVTPNGDLVLLNATTGDVFWSSNCSENEPGRVAQLLETGNLVLRREDDTTQNYVWQSFDYPSDTLLPGMKFGWSTGTNRYLTAWKDDSDPSPGDVSFRLENIGMPQFVLRKGSETIYRSGPWNGIEFSGSYGWDSAFKQIFVYNNEELYFMNEIVNNSFVIMLTVYPSGLVQSILLKKGVFSSNALDSTQNDRCERYGLCGANSMCKIKSSPICECLYGFVPKSPNEWEKLYWSGGCVRRTSLSCPKHPNKFLKLGGVKPPDLLQFSLNKSMSLKECRLECLKNCTCKAYANSDIHEDGSGCFMWFGDLFDIRECSKRKQQYIYIRMAATELQHNKTTKLVLITIVSSTSGMLMLGFSILCLIKKSRRKRASEFNGKDMELPMFNLTTITTATENFSPKNIIGEGGFGIVYKGTLSTGLEVAVKRLNSGQGLKEFKNEVILIAKLQHRNLVRLLGCCLEGDERVLIYEYMPNKSLDYFIFGQSASLALLSNESTTNKNTSIY